jgi:uncharacterized protein YhbP (UPF0306 family)
MDKKIQSFIESQKNLTFCTAIDNAPYCASCFYSYVLEGNFIIFKSDKKTTHIANALINDKVAGTIIPDLDKVGTIRGIQFTGNFIVPSGDLLEQAKKKHYSKYPFALAVGGDLWAIELLSIKMTDNTLGFGKKLSWEKQTITQ